MDLDEAADDLYGGTPEDFVSRRAALVKQARAAKDRELATAIGALRRPTRTAWLVNLLAREAADEVSALLDLGPALREAQAARDGSGLRALSARRRTMIDALTRRAAELGQERGHHATEATQAEVAATLQAALGDPTVTEQVRQGRLAAAAVYGGFGTPVEPGADRADGGSEDLLAALAASLPARRDEPPPAPEAPPEDEVGRRRRAALKQAWEDASAALEQAQAAAEQATEQADALAEQVDRLRDELERTEQAEREARAAARAARQQVPPRRQEADDAEQAWRAAEDAAR